MGSSTGTGRRDRSRFCAGGFYRRTVSSPTFRYVVVIFQRRRGKRHSGKEGRGTSELIHHSVGINSHKVAMRRLEGAGDRYIQVFQRRGDTFILLGEDGDSSLKADWVKKNPNQPMGPEHVTRNE